MGKVRKVGNKWEIRFRLPRRLAAKYGRNSVKWKFEKKSEANEMHANVSRAIALDDKDGWLSDRLGISHSGVTVQQFYDRWIAEYAPHLTDSTLTRYKLSFKSILDFCGSMPMEDFRRQVAHGYAEKRTAEVSKSTINKDLIALKSMFSYAFEVGTIENNPLIRFASLPVQEKAMRIPTPEEYAALVKAMPDPAIAAMVVIMGECGLRRSEAINLEWKHVDYANKRITLEGTKGKRVRIVPLSGKAIGALRSLRRFVHAPFIFVHQISGERWTSPDKAFRIARKKAKLGWVTFHTLRHMRCTRWLEEGHHPVQVQKWMGHRDIQTTMRYEHYKQNQEATGTFPGLRGGK